MKDFSSSNANACHIQYISPWQHKIMKYMSPLSLGCQAVVHLDVSLHPSLTVSLALVQPTSAGKAPLEKPSQQRYGRRKKTRNNDEDENRAHLQLEGTILRFSQEQQDSLTFTQDP